MIADRINKAELTNETSYALFKRIGAQIREGEIQIGRKHYALSLAHSVKQAIHCGYDQIVAIELGVGTGKGLLDLCKAAEFFRDMLEIDIQVYGLDNGTGLPQAADYRDHPEIWQQGFYSMQNSQSLQKKLPSFAKLLLGEVGDTVMQLLNNLGNAKIAFVALDLDYYSSTKRALKLLTSENAEHYLPAVPIYVDDVEIFITLNESCGEAAAINEFNAQFPHRRIEPKPNFDIQRFHVCHVLDHPIRHGIVKPKIPLFISMI